MPLLATLGSHLIAGLADASLRALLLAVLAAGGILVARIRSAALRHALWATVLTAMLLMPLLGLLLPPLPLRILKPQTAAPAAVISEAPVAVAADFSSPERLAKDSVNFSAAPASGPLQARIPVWFAIGCALYLAVALAFLSRVLLGYALARRLLSNSEPIRETGARNVLEDLAVAERMRWPLPQLRESRSVVVPLTVGWRHPVILLKGDWREWDGWKLRAVLAHELAHIRRRDWLITVLAALNKCLFWFHPLAWWLERRLVGLAEQASDEASLLANGDAARYAEVVLEFAAGVKGRRLLAEGTTMACSRNVTGRINRILDLRRAGPGVLRPAAWLVVLACCLPLVYAVSATRLQSPPPPPPGLVIQAPEFLKYLGAGLSPADAARLEQKLSANPEDLDTRMTLIGYYFINAMWEKRGSHVFWLIEHHPESDFCVSYAARISAAPAALRQMERPSPTANPVEDYEHAKALWLRQAALHPGDVRVLKNAAESLSRPDPELAEELLKRAIQLDPSLKGRLASLYAGAIVGNYPPEPDSGFSERVLAELQASKDAELVGTVGERVARNSILSARTAFGSQAPEALVAQFRDREKRSVGCAEMLLRHAISLDLSNPRWQKALEELQAPQAPSTQTEYAYREQDFKLDSAGRVHVAASLQESRLVQGPLPEYPPLARQVRLQGSVRFEAVITKDGHVAEAKVISGHPLLLAAAQEAVKQWVYQPTLVNGAPVEVVTQINVPFTLDATAR